MTGARARLSNALKTVDVDNGFAHKLEIAYRSLWRAQTDGALAPGTLVPMESET